MTTICNGHRYDSRQTTTIAEQEHRSHSGNYAGTTSLELAKDGMLLLLTVSNGQDLYLTDSFRAITRDEALSWLDGLDLTDEEATACADAGLITLDTDTSPP